MKKSGFVLIAIIVVGLSLGPLTYFSGIGGGGEELGPVNETQGNQENFYVASSNLTGYVKEIEPYVYFEGIKETNNASKAKKEIASVLPETDNYSLDLSLGQKGWRYTVKIPVENRSRASEVGFKLSFALNPFYQGSVTYRKAEAGLPRNITGSTAKGGDMLIQTDNKTVNTNLVYSKGEEDVELNCPKMIVAKNGKLASVPARCAQRESTFFDYGVTQEHFQKKGRTMKKNQTLDVLGVKEYEAKYQSPQNFTNQDIQELKKIESEVTINQELRTATARDTNFTRFNESIQYFKEAEYYKLGESKILEVDLPDNVTLENKNYPVLPSELDTGTVKVSLGYSGETLGTTNLYRLLYDYIFAVRIKIRS